MPDRGLFLPIFRSRTLTKVAFLATFTAAYGSLSVWKERSIFRDYADTPSQIHAAMALILGWLLVFRTNSAYSRWWEARTLWGALVNASRNLTIKVTEMVRLPPDAINQARRDIIAFAYSLKQHLREGAVLDTLPGYANATDQVDHIPSFLVARRYAALRDWKDKGLIDGDELRVIDRELGRFLDICGGCERIRKTRVVRSYRLFARQCVIVFLLTFPWGIVDDFGSWTIPLTGITAYFMIGLEIVAEHVEEPFGRDEDDLNLEQICTAIESSVTEISREAAG